MLLNDTLDILGIYDSGSNVSLISAKLLKMKHDSKNETKILSLKTINVVKDANEMINLKIKIYNIEKTMNAFIVNDEHFNYDFLIGLDYIKKFQLVRNENLGITHSKI